jgi:transglutaminase-like putative cysteine protease
VFWSSEAQKKVRVYHPNFGHDIAISGAPLSEDPDTQVAQVVGLMLDYSTADAATAELRADATAASLLAGDDPIAGNFWDVKRRLRFVEDAETGAPFAAEFPSSEIVETLVRPIDMRAMASPAGDCDDFSMTTRARLLALGIPARFVTVAVDPEDPSRFSHVYVVADCDGGVCGSNWSGRVALDTSHGDYPGWECPNPFGKREEWPAAGWSIAAALAIAGAAAWWLLK